MEETQIFEQDLINKEGIVVGKLAIILGGIGNGNPKAVVDEAVAQYVGAESYCQFTDIHLDNPWVRVVIKGIGDISYEKLTGDHHL